MGTIGAVSSIASLAGGGKGGGGGGGGGAGGIDPLQSAATEQSLQQRLVGLGTEYGGHNLGLSTMKTEAAGGANLAAALQASQFEQQNTANALNLADQVASAGRALGQASTGTPTGGSLGTTTGSLDTTSAG